MSKALYTAASGGNQVLEQMNTATHNLANVSTDGFRAKLDGFRAIQTISQDLPVQAFVLNTSVASDFTPAAIHQTGRDLDVAISGHGWLVVQDEKGQEAYTRGGSLQMDANGILRTQSGWAVLGDSGPISLPPDETITIAKDGTLSSIPVGNKVANVNVVGRLKLVNPNEKDLIRGDDGLFRTQNGLAAEVDASVRLVSGGVEESNVNAITSLVEFITLSRKLDANARLITSLQTNDEKSSTVLSRT